MARGLFAVLEDELSGEIVPENTEQQERVEELEAQVAEAQVTEAEGEVEELVEAVEEAVDGVEEIEEIAEVAEDSVEAGDGLTEEAAEIAEVAVESICNRLGYKPAKRIVPAMESFGAVSSRLDATKYALEGFKETVSKIWEGIKAFFAKIGDSLKALWNKLFDLATKTAARAESLTKKVKKAQKDKLVAGKGKVKVGKFHAAFNVASGDITAAAINVIGTHLVIAGKSATVNIKMVANLETVAKAESVADVTLTDADFGDIAKGQLAYGYTAEVKEGVLVLTSAPVKAEADAESDAADLATLLTLANHAMAFAANISAYKGGAGKAQDVVKKAIALADKLAKKEGGENAKEQAKAFRNVQTNLVAINKTIPVLGLRASGAALDFVAANLKAYSVPAAK
jgi:hypothetical protein